jgi:hypothetical protein
MAAPTVLRSGLVVWLACLATAVVVPVMLSDPGATAAQPEARPLDDHGDEVRELQERIDDLERQLAFLALELEQDPPPIEPLRPENLSDPGASFGEGAAQPFDLEDRLARLEGFESERQLALAAAESERQRNREIARVLEASQVGESHAVILDPNAPDRDKTSAWTKLRRMDGEPWTDEVVLEMLRIGEGSEDDRAREEVWIGADSRHRNDLLASPLVRALSGDRSANVREEAADALKRYLDMPGVRDALIFASTNDASAKVRSEALEALMRGGN